MCNLAQARQELVRLEQQERDLTEQLCNVRAAVLSQRAKVEELVGQTPAPINRLPAEILLHIFEISIQATLADFESCDVHRHCKRDLAGVSRHWRDLVLQSPSLWTTIKVNPLWTESLVRTHVQRSCQSPLHIEISSWGRGGTKEAFVAMLDALTPSAHRWRDVVIKASVPCFHTSLVLERIDALTLPSLTHVSVGNIPLVLHGKLEVYKSRFLESGHIPNLRSLELGGQLLSSGDFRVPHNLTALTLDFSYLDELIVPSSVFYALGSFQSLTMLSLSGYINFHPDPDTIHLPFLEKFICKLGNSMEFIHAIVSPALTHLEAPQLAGKVFDGLESKFNSVTHLVVGVVAFGCLENICLAFPDVRHVVLDVSGIFQVGVCSGTVSYWPHLETLTVHGLNTSDFYLGEHMVNWLARRQNMGRTKLKVVINLPSYGNHWEVIASLYQALHEHRILDRHDIYVSGKYAASGITGGLLRMVCSFLSLTFAS
ncbi:hypothetical protein ID866_5434 [Astraeus odoratus]|nr:hypothetical protein ID866_5434 [Astraeus odoratus]